MIAFCDLPDNERFRLIRAIDEHGGDVDGYAGDNVRLLLPTEWLPFVDRMARLGLKLIGGTRYYWPLGTERYPDHQLHDASYPGSRGFYCTALFNVPDFCLI